MRTKSVAALLVAVFVFAPSAARNILVAAEKDSDRESVAAATAQFYAALNKLFEGDAKPMQEVWSHADDVTYMGPAGGMQVGWKQVRKSWESQAALRLGGKIASDGLHIHVGHDIAVTTGYELGQNTVDGKVQKVSIRATNIFRKENGRWKMIGHHTDLLPYLQEKD